MAPSKKCLLLRRSGGTQKEVVAPGKKWWLLETFGCPFVRSGGPFDFASENTCTHTPLAEEHHLVFEALGERCREFEVYADTRVVFHGVLGPTEMVVRPSANPIVERLSTPIRVEQISLHE